MSDLPPPEVKFPLTEKNAGTTAADSLPSDTLSGVALPPAWKFRDLITYLIFSLMSLVLVQALAWFCYGLLRPWLGLSLPPELVFRSAYGAVAIQTIFYSLQFGFIYLLVVGGYGRPFCASLRLTRPKRDSVQFSLIMGLGLALLVTFLPPVLPDKETFPLQELFSSPGAAFTIATFAVTLAPLIEELIFRGFIFAILEKTVDTKTAIVISATLFALSHVPEYWGAWDHILRVSLVGLALSITRAWTGSLTPSIIIHTTYNFVLITIIYFQTNGFQKLAVTLGNQK